MQASNNANNYGVIGYNGGGDENGTKSVTTTSNKNSKTSLSSKGVSVG